MSITITEVSIVITATAATVGSLLCVTLLKIFTGSVCKEGL